MEGSAAQCGAHCPLQTGVVKEGSGEVPANWLGQENVAIGWLLGVAKGEKW